MSLVKMNDVLQDAFRNRYAVPAFNVCNLEYAKVVIETAEQMEAPVIVAVHPTEHEYAGIEELTAIVKQLARKAKVPVVLHLDHGESLVQVAHALIHGFTSVMYDGSKQSYEQNLSQTREIARVAHAAGIPVEAELGIVGGAEGSSYVHAGGLNPDQLTDPDMAFDFVKQTGVDSLAVAIGNAHGLYRSEPRIDIERLKQIRRKVDVPLVLHGGSGTPDPVILECIQNGIAKINIASELKLAFHQGMKQAMLERPDVYEPLVILKAGCDSARELVKSKLELFQTAGKAGRII
jgi:ketose-bisphosphate aldolase